MADIPEDHLGEPRAALMLEASAESVIHQHPTALDDASNRSKAQDYLRQLAEATAAVNR